MSHPTGQVLITCAPPNPNGDLHLGHLSGPFLGADVLRRYLRSRGRVADYVSYTDDESCYLPRRAAELGSNPQEVAHRYTRRIEQTLSMADMLPDYYAHPHREPRHRRTVQEQFLRLYEAGVLRTRTLATPYCETCDKFLYEADLRGVCRFCHLPCDGTYCEDCGFPQDPDGSFDNRCVRCGEAPSTRPTTRLVLPLAEHTAAMRAYYAGRRWPRRAGEFCAEMLECGLPDVPITRIAGYGIPVPLPGWEGHILDTWFSGIYGYMAATEGLGAARGEPDLAQRLWNSEDTTLVHFIGFDCTFSHAVLWPAMLLAMGARTVPRYIIGNEFYHLEGEKFSTSRGHAIWGSEFLRETPADAVRFHLCSTNPELAPANFSRSEFDHSLRTVLAGHLDGWTATALDLLAADRGAPVPAADWPDTVRQSADRLPGTVQRALDPQGFSLRSAAGAITSTVVWADADLRTRRSTGPVDRAALAAHAELLAVLAVVASPLMPTWSARVRKHLGQPATGPDDAPRWPAPGERMVRTTDVSAGRYRAHFRA